MESLSNTGNGEENIRELENVVARYFDSGFAGYGRAGAAAEAVFHGPAHRVGLDGTIPLKRIAKQAVRENGKGT